MGRHVILKTVEMTCMIEEIRYETLKERRAAYGQRYLFTRLRSILLLEKFLQNCFFIQKEGVCKKCKCNQSLVK